MLLKGSAECVYLCQCVPSRVCFRRVLQCFIEQDGAPPALIPLLFIGLDGPCSNCIRAPLHRPLPPPQPYPRPRTSLFTVLTTCQYRHVKNTRRGELLVKVVQVIILLHTPALLGGRRREVVAWVGVGG